jgi:LysR family transcriptional regulator, glycine cleavage system transcriptional activator
MPRRIPNLNALRAFEAASRHLSFSRAADDLCVTQAAVSRHIKHLEEDIGVRLFARLTRAVALTAEGRNYAAEVREIFERLERATYQLRSATERRVLTLNVLPTFAMRYLIPRMPRFSRANPGVEVRLVMSIDIIDFDRDELDLAIRVGEPPQSNRHRSGPRIDLQMVRDWRSITYDFLAPDTLVPVGSKSFFKRYGPFLEPKDFIKKPLIHTATRSHAWRDWFMAFGLENPDVDEGLKFGHFFMAMQAASEGHGLALIPKILLDDFQRHEGLQWLDQFSVGSAGSYHVLGRLHEWNAPHIEAFRKWLKTECSQGASNVSSGGYDASAGL